MARIGEMKLRAKTSLENTTGNIFAYGFLKDGRYLIADCLLTFVKRKMFHGVCCCYYHHHHHHGSTALSWALSSSIVCTVGRTPRTGAQPVAWPLHTEQNRIEAHRHPCLELASNPWPQCWRGPRQVMPYTARPFLSTVYWYFLDLMGQVTGSTRNPADHRLFRKTSFMHNLCWNFHSGEED